MKILLVNNDKGWGGGQEHLKELARQFLHVGHDPHFLCRSKSPSEQKYSLLGCPVYGVFAGGGTILQSLYRTARILRREVFDVIMVTREHDLLRTVLAWKLAFPLKKKSKLVVCYHTATSRKQLFLCSVDAIICISTFIKDTLLSACPAPPAPVTVISNGIAVGAEPAPEKFSVTRKHRYFEHTTFPLIGMVGAFFKNQEELLEIVLILKKEFPTIKVALVGDDSDSGLTGPIVARARALGVEDSLIFTGKVPHEKLSEVYFDFDISVSTFRNEGFGLVHLESMAAGTPVIAYNEGGQVDILRDGKGGILVDGGVAEFAAAVHGLLKDHEQRFALGRCGYALVRDRFSAERMGRNYSDFLENLIVEVL
ncbi:MAG: glycosyltransferase family 4 protein [Geobacteraceae bacterium]